MAGKTLAWQLELLDKMSAPARTMDRNLGRLDDALEKATGGSSQLDRGLDRLAGGFDKAGRAAKRADSDIGAFAMSGAVALGNFASSAATAAVDKMLELAAAGAEAAWAFHRFDESTRFAFDGMLGAAKGAQAYEKAISTANALGASQEDVLKSYNALIPAFEGNIEKVDSLVRSMSDLKALNPATDLSNLAKTITQIQATGKLQGDELQELATSGIGAVEVYKQLEKALGKSREEVIALKEAGKITSDQAIKAIQDAIAARTGGGDAGDLAALKALETIDGQMGRLTNRAEEFVRTLSLDGGAGVDALSRFVDLIDVDTKSGQQLQKTVEKLVEAGASFSSEAFEGFANAMERALPSVERMTESIDPKTWEVIGWAVGETANQLAVLGYMAELAATPFQYLDSAIWGTIGAVSNMYETVTNYMELSGSTWGELAADAGQAIVDGLVGALESGAGKIIAAMTNPVAGGIDIINNKLTKSHSPSKVFEEIGNNITDGLVIGLDAKETQGAITGLIDPTAAGEAAAGTVTNISNVSKAGPQVTNNFTINVNGDGKSVAAQIRAELENALAAVA